MAKGGKSSSGTSNGGIGGSGIFGFFGTTIKCDATDTSIYCTIMKLFNLLIIFFVVGYIMYFAYSYFSPMKFIKKSRK
jgi:hypothetical protein